MSPILQGHRSWVLGGTVSFSANQQTPRWCDNFFVITFFPDGVGSRRFSRSFSKSLGLPLCDRRQPSSHSLSLSLSPKEGQTPFVNAHAYKYALPLSSFAEGKRAQEVWSGARTTVVSTIIDMHGYSAVLSSQARPAPSRQGLGAYTPRGGHW